MLELSKIGFTVDTKQLEDAAVKLADLGLAATKLSTDIKKLDKASAEATVTQNKANLAAEKTATQAAKTAEILERTEAKKQKAIEKTTKSTKDAQVAQLGLVEGIERKRDLISEGWTRGESSVLKMAEAMGIAGGEMEKLKGLLRDIGGLASNPFDSTLGSLRSIQKEFDGLVLRSKLVAQGIELNSTQLKQFARIAAEASVAVKKMGMDPTEGAGLEMYNKLLTESQDAYLKVAVANKTMLDGEKLLAKQHRDTASAKSFLIKEDERMISVVEQMNSGTNRSVSISEKAATATANYARALKTAGIAGDEARTRLAKYSAAQQLASEKEEQRAASNLARALQPQATDVLVSLWSGQAPLTVLLQQGGQVVDLFKLSGIEASKLGATMKAAFAGMLPSILSVGSAIGGLVKDGIVGLVNGFSNLVSKFSLVTAATDGIRDGIAFFSKDFDSATANIAKFDKVAAGFGKVFAAGVLSAIVVLGLLAVEMYNIMKITTELNQAMAVSGASLGMSSKEAYGYAISLNEVGVSSTKGIEVMTQMAKAGNLQAGSFTTIAKAAVEMSKYTDQAIEDTVKQFSKLADDPSKVLTDLAISQGYVTQETLNQVVALEQQGRTIEAVELATKAYGDSLLQAANDSKENLSGLEKAWFQVKSAMGAVKEVMFDLANSDAPKILGTAWAVFGTVVSEVWFWLTQVGKAMGAMAAATIQFSSGNFANTFTIIKESVSDFAKARVEQNELVKGLFAGNTASAEAAKLAADARQSRSEAAKVTKYTNELTEKGLTDQKRAVNEIVRLQGELNSARNRGLATVQLEAATENAIQKQRDIIFGKDKKDKKPKVDKDQKELENYIKRTEERIKDLGIQASGVTNDITASGKALMDIMDDKLWLSLTQEQRVQWGLMLRKSEEQEILNKKVNSEKKLLEDITKIRNENDRFIQNEIQESEKLNSSLQLRLDLIGKTTEEQKKIKASYDQAVKLAGVEAKFADQRLKTDQKFKELRDKPNADLMQIEADRLIEQEKLEKQFQDSRVALSKESAVIIAEDSYAEMKKITGPIADALSEALLKGGDSAFDDMWKTLQNEFINKPFKIKLEGIIDSIANGGNGGLGSLGGIGDMLSAGAKMLGIDTGKLGSTITSSLGSLGKMFGLDVGKIGGSLSSLSTSSLFSNGSKMSGSDKMGGIMSYVDALGNAKDGSWGKSIGQGIGTYFGGPFGGQIGKALGGVVDKWFSKEYVASNGDANVTFDSQGNRLRTKTAAEINTNGLGKTTAEADALVQGLQNQYLKTARELGLGVVATEFSYGSNNSDGGKFQLGGGATGRNGVNQEETKATPEAIQLAGSRAVFAALQSSDLPKYLKGAFDGLSAGKMGQDEINAAIEGAQALKMLNDSFLAMPFTQLHDLSFMATKNLIEFSGGIDGLQNTLSGYYDNFYTENEKIAFVTKSLTSQFSSLGITMPAVNESTREWYRSEVDRQLALDQSIPANAQATAALLALQSSVNQIAPAFAEADSAIDKTAETIKAMADKLASAMSGLTDTRFDLENQLLTLKGMTDEVAARTRANDISKLVDGVTPEGAAQITAAYDYNLELKAQIKAQEDAAKAAASAADAQRDYQNSLRQAAQESINAAEQIRTAWQSITDSLYDEVKRIRGLVMGDTSVGLSAAQSDFNNATARARAGDQEAAKALPALSQVLLTLAQGQASTLIELRRAQALTANSLEQTANGISSTYGLSIPAYASGGSYDGGLALVGEQGPELINFSNPGQVYTASQTASMMNGSSEMVSELKRLNSKIDNLEAAARSSAISNNKVAKILDLVTPERTSVVISGTVTTV